ncbi:MAG TPA: hypothetical protein VLU43_15770 [Anaeromyxobacteraceae bacterium]|nr:hypothetical protein [Anaeromyxobacteraceae bacterium]
MRRASFAAVAVLLLVALAAACAGARGLPAGQGEDAARETLRRFARDLQEKRWPDAYALLSARWRTAYTPSRLATDWDGAGSIGREESERVLALLAAGVPLTREGGSLALPVGTGHRAVVVAEDGGWRVDALE